MSIAEEETLLTLKKYYNGYLFSESGSVRVFNSDMVLYYLKEYVSTGEPPRDLIDENIASDYSKLQKLFGLKEKAQNMGITTLQVPNYVIKEAVGHNSPLPGAACVGIAEVF